MLIIVLFLLALFGWISWVSCGLGFLVLFVLGLLMRESPSPRKKTPWVPLSSTSRFVSYELQAGRAVSLDERLRLVRQWSRAQKKQAQVKPCGA